MSPTFDVFFANVISFISIEITEVDISIYERNTRWRIKSAMTSPSVCQNIAFFGVRVSNGYNPKMSAWEPVSTNSRIRISSTIL